VVRNGVLLACVNVKWHPASARHAHLRAALVEDSVCVEVSGLGPITMNKGLLQKELERA